ncbi:hypothetical protein [Nocardia sp. XZ_19_369]|nr:hypothetical protein [Nocardia sp. XZ_19_369]
MMNALSQFLAEHFFHLVTGGFIIWFLRKAVSNAVRPAEDDDAPADEDTEANERAGESALG